MSKAVSDLAVLLRTMEPVLNERVYVYSVVPLNTDLRAVRPVATFCEAEGLTLIIAEAEAVKAGFPALFSRCMDHTQRAVRSSSRGFYCCVRARTQ